MLSCEGKEARVMVLGRKFGLDDRLRFIQPRPMAMAPPPSSRPGTYLRCSSFFALFSERTGCESVSISCVLERVQSY